MDRKTRERIAIGELMVVPITGEITCGCGFCRRYALEKLSGSMGLVPFSETEAGRSLIADPLAKEQKCEGHRL